MDTEAVRQMLRDDRAEWERLAPVLDAHPEEHLHDPGSPPFTSRDAYAHFARWMERSTDEMEAHLAGQPLPPLEGSEDEINGRWQEEDRRLSLDDARTWAQRAFERRFRAIEAVPPDRWDPGLEAIARADGAEHYRAHRGYIVVA